MPASPPSCLAGRLQSSLCLLLAALALTLAAAACSGPGNGDVLVLAAPGIRLEVDRYPYALRVYDRDGRLVLSSLGRGGRSGYGALSWAGGRVSWENVISPGYYRMNAELTGWHGDFVVVEASASDGVLELLLRDPHVGSDEPGITVRHLVRASTLRVEVSAPDIHPRAWAAAFESPADEAFLGFGERFNRTNQRGLNVYSWLEEGGIGAGEGSEPGPQNPYPNGEVMTYYPVPFFISTAGYAFWLDSTWYNEFELASTRADAWQVWHIGPELAYEVYLPLIGDERPWPYHLIDLFTAATGRPLVPPAWAFGPRRRINRGDTQGGVPEIQAMRDLDLAITAVDDSVHFLPRGSHVGHEQEIRDWIEQARRLGYRVNCYYNPYLASAEDSPLRSEVERALGQRWLLENADGTPSEVWMVSGSMMKMYMVDFSISAATAWYQSLLQWALDLGYSGWMYDFGEYVQPGTRARNGMSGEQFHNLYTVLYQQAAHDYLESGPQAGDWLTFVRSGYTGASAYSPFVWSGDPAASFDPADGLPSMVRAGVNLGISGAPHWGGDINGFHGTADGYEAADEELLVRWIQQGAMSPNMQDQDAMVGVLEGQGRKANIFDDPLAQQAWREYARLHTRLFPYLYTLSRQAHQTGAPLMRQMFLEHPDRPDLADRDDAYYLGPALLVAPVVARGAREKSVELVDEYYLDWRDIELVRGPGRVTLPAPLEKLPLLLRAGHLVPLLDPAIDTLAAEEHPDVVGPADVSDVYDVVGLLAPGHEQALFNVYDGTELRAELSSSPAPPDGFTEAASVEELASCSGCYLFGELSGGLQRLRVSAPAGTVTAGGLRLSSSGSRRIRWDVFVAD